MSKPKTSKESDAEMNKNMAIISYVWILCLIPLLGNKKSEFVQFHAKQGFVLFLLSFATIVPFFGQILCLVLFFVSVWAIIKTLNGEKWEIPVIFEWSKKIKI